MILRLFLVILIVILTSCASLPKHFADVQTLRPLSFENLINEIQTERVIFVGEFHGDRKSHAVEFEVIKSLHEKGKDIVIGFEMFPYTSQHELDGWVDGSTDKRKFLEIFQHHVNLPFYYYKNIFEYAREWGIPIVGINSDKTLIRNVSINGIEAAPAKVLAELKFSGCSQNHEYTKMFAKKYHSNKMTFLCNGQRLRDTYMAYNIAKILEDNDSIVVVIVGIAHAVKVAVPQILNQYKPLPYKVILPEGVKRILERRLDTGITDYIWY
jgi:uncharacterized iron-regulated protein